MLKKAVFLDRDGVLNASIIKHGKPYPPATVDQVVIPEDVPHALAALKKAGYWLIVVTNQPDVARGKTTRTMVEAIHHKLRSELLLDDIRVCYHDDDDQCACRKPLPGLLLQAGQDHGIDLTQSFIIGDRWKDIEAGKNAGCKTIWLQQHYDEKAPPRKPDFITSTMEQASTWIIHH